MTGSRADQCLRAAIITAFTAAAFLISHDTGLAQSTAPVSLIPKTADRPGSDPEVLKVEPEAPEIVRSIPGTTDSSVQIRGLDAVDTDAVGLSQQNGDLQTDMWRGTSRAVAERLLASLPERLASDAAHDLARRLLLIAAEPPAGGRGNVSLVKLRAERLIALGAAEDATRLMRAVSSRSVPAELVDVAVQSRLLTSDFAGACEAVNSTNLGRISEFKQKALIFCQLLNQEFSTAVLGLELLREQNLAQDAIFFELSNAIISGAPPTQEQLGVPGQANALNLALIRLADGSVPSWLVEAASPSLLKAIASAPNADREVRLTAARAAARWGALSPAELSDVYSLLNIGAEEVATILLEPETASEGLLLAVMYLAAESQNIPVARAEVLREMWRLAGKQQDWRLAARLTAPQLGRVQPETAFAWFAGDAMAASLAAGNTDLALDWLEVAESRRVADETVGDALIAVWPSLRIATAPESAADENIAQVQTFDSTEGPDIATVSTAVSVAPVQSDPVPWDERRLAEWIAAQETKGPQGATAVASLLTLFDALEEPVSDALWLRAEGAELASANLAPLDAWIGLRRAAEAGKVAETAIHALRSVGEGELSQLHPAVLHTVIRALQRVGLSDTARAFALEFAVTTAQ